MLASTVARRWLVTTTVCVYAWAHAWPPRAEVCMANLYIKMVSANLHIKMLSAWTQPQDGRVEAASEP